MERSQNSLGRLSLIVGICLFLLLAVSLVYRSLLLAFLLSALLSYILSPVVNFLEHKLKLGRAVPAGLLLCGLVSLCFVLIGSLAPLFYDEGLQILKLAPRAFQAVMDRSQPVQEFLVAQGLLSPDMLGNFLADFDLFEQVAGQTQVAIKQLWNTTPRVLGGVLNLLLIPFMVFFILKDMKGLQNSLWSLVPDRSKVSVARYMATLDIALISVIKGQLLVASILSCMYMVGLGGIGLKFGVAIGLLAGICRIVPYLDVFIGVLLCVIVITSENLGLGMTFAVAVVFIVVQLVDGMLITPRIIGERAGLHPAVVVVSILAFGDWMGLLGVIVAVPFLALLKVSGQEVLARYKKSDFYRSGGGIL